jgi:hypothetical protein
VDGDGTAGIGVVEGVGEQIVDDLCQPSFVAGDDRGREVGSQLDAFLGERDLACRGARLAVRQLRLRRYLAHRLPRRPAQARRTHVVLHGTADRPNHDVVVQDYGVVQGSTS